MKIFYFRIPTLIAIATSTQNRICRRGDAWDPPALIRFASHNRGEIIGDKLTNYASAGLGFRLALAL